MLDAAAEPTAGETRALIELLAPAVLLALGLLVLTNVAVLITMWGRR